MSLAGLHCGEGRPVTCLNIYYIQLYLLYRDKCPGEREGGCHPLAFSSFSALCGARSRTSVKPDSDYSRTGHKFLAFTASFAEDFFVSSLSRAINACFVQVSLIFAKVQ